MAKTRLREVHPQRPVNYNEKAIQKILETTGYVFAQVKHDGFRCLVWEERGDIKCVTREGFEITALNERKNLFKDIYVKRPELFGHVLDCEVWLPTVLRESGFDVCSGLLRKEEPLAKDVQVVFSIFDVVPQQLIFGAKDTPVAPLHKRIQRLGNVTAEFGKTLVAVVTSVICTSHVQIQEEYELQRKLGYEGIVVKDPTQVYKPSKVNGWFKVKPSETQDGKIIGFVDGDKGNKGKLVGFVVELEGGAEVRATGLTRELITAVTADPQSFIGRYVEVSGMEESTQGKIRHPKFKCFRDLDAAKGEKL